MDNKTPEQKIAEIAVELKALANTDVVTENKKAEFKARTGVGISTINRYLEGEVSNLLTGRALLGFFNGIYTVEL